LGYPGVVGAVEIAIGDLELDPPRLAPAGNPLAIGEGTGQHLAVRERDAHHLGGPEEAGGVADDDRDEADDHAEGGGERAAGQPDRSEEHTSELQSRSDLVCRLLLEKKKKKNFQLSYSRFI